MFTPSSGSTDVAQRLADVSIGRHVLHHLSQSRFDPISSVYTERNGIIGTERQIR